MDEPSRAATPPPSVRQRLLDGESYRMRAHRARADNLRKAVTTKTNT